MPVARNLYTIGEGGDFFRSVYKQRPKYQGLCVVSPGGKALASHNETMDLSHWRDKVLANLEAGFKAFGPIEPRRPGLAQPLPDRGVGLRRDGGVTLAVSDKVIFVKDLDHELPRDAIGPTVFDGIPLTREEWTGLALPEAAEGGRWDVPEAVVRRLFPVLSLSDSTFGSPGKVTGVRLSATVRSVWDGVAHLGFEGRITGVHHGTENEARKGQECSSEARLLGGVGRYDVRTGAMLSLTLV